MSPACARDADLESENKAPSVQELASTPFVVVNSLKQKQTAVPSEMESSKLEPSWLAACQCSSRSACKSSDGSFPHRVWKLLDSMKARADFLREGSKPLAECRYEIRRLVLLSIELPAGAHSMRCALELQLV